VSGVVQLAPPGFLGFFQLKNFGKNPSPMSDPLTPVIETLDWYMRGQQVWQDGLELEPVTGQNLFTSFAVPLIVPQGEWWRVHQLRLYTTLLSTEFLDMRPTYNVGNTNSARFGGLTNPNHVQGSASVVTSPIVDLAEPWWLPPGAEIGVACPVATTSGTISIVGALLYTRLPI